MKKLILAVAACLSAGVANASEGMTPWYLLTFSSDTAYFINDASKVRDGNTVSAWIAQAMLNPTPHYDMLLIAWEANCKKQTLKIADMGHYLNGNPVGPRYVDDGKSMRVRPGSFSATIYDALCKKTDKSYPFKPSNMKELSMFGRFLLEEMKNNPPKP